MPPYPLLLVLFLGLLQQSTGQPVIIRPIDELGLKVVTVLPASTSVGSDSSLPVQISGRTALVVVFNRAVIALGSDFGDGELPNDKTPFFLSVNIPGKLRWVTTSIARWDPDQDLPTDLVFELQFNVAGLVTYDGKKLPSSAVLGNTAPRRFATPKIDWWLQGITSKKANELTDNQWSPLNTNEVPPDGVVRIQFTSLVNITMLKSALQMSVARELPIEACSPGKQEDSCVLIRPGEYFSIGECYALRFPAGARYHPLAGATSRQLSISLCGLLNFSFPFLQTTVPDNVNIGIRPVYRRYDLWLRHGLLNDKMLDKLADSITIQEATATKSLPFSLSRPNKATLRLTADFNPSTRYTILVRANSEALDGFSLPLVSSQTSFTTAPRSQEWFSPSNQYRTTSFFERNETSVTVKEWKILGQGGPSSNPQCGTDQWRFTANNVNLRNVATAIGVQQLSRESKVHLTPDQVVQSTYPATIQTFTLPTQSLFGESGTFLLQKYQTSSQCQNVCLKNKYSEFISMTNIAVALAAPNYGEVVAWVTDISTGNPVPDAQVFLHRVDTSQSVCGSSLPSITTVTQSTTDSDGIATFLDTSTTGYYPNYFIAVYEPISKDLLVFDAAITRYTPPSTSTVITQVSLLTDSSIYKEGELVHFKGYVRQRLSNSHEWTLATSLKDVSLNVHWKSPAQIVPITINPTFGTFNISLPVPDDVTYGNKYAYASSQGKNIGSTSFLIADPRLPTVELAFSSPDRILRPGSSLQLDIETSTSTQLPVGGAYVSLKWWLYRKTSYKPSYYYCDVIPTRVTIIGNDYLIGDPDSTTSIPNESGETFAVTDALTGTTTVHFDAPYEIAPREGDRLEIHAAWISPTGEQLEKELTFPVSASEWEITLLPSVDNPLPGYEFGFFINLRDIITQQAILDKTVTVSLVEWNAASTISDVNSRLGRAVDSCVVQSDGGSALGCRLVMPAVRNYMAVATVVDPKDVTVKTSYPLGKTVAQWQNDPLRSFDGISILPDKTEYAVGDTVKLTFDNPFANARALLVWGDMNSKKRKLIELEQGSQTLQFVLGDECVAGCNAGLIISAPRQTATLLPVPVPVSPLFDIDAPRSITRTFGISVPNEEKFDVEVVLDSPVARPGQTTGFTVKASLNGRAINNVEVTVMAVNKAIFQLKEQPLRKLHQEWQVNLADYIRLSDTRSDLVTEGYLSAYNTLLRRIRLDPFLDRTVSLWSLKPSSSYSRALNPAEMTDEAYFASLTTQITSFPYTPYTCASREVDNPQAGPPANQDSVGGGGSSESTSDVRVRSNFVNTPLWIADLQITTGGQVHVDFPLPDNVATFVIRAYGVRRRNSYGSAETELIVRQPISLQPKVPRIVRTGDQFVAGVTVGAEDSSFDDTVEVSIREISGITTLGPVVYRKKVQGTTPVAFQFNFAAERVGEAVLVFTARALKTTDRLAGDVAIQDSIEVRIPVLGIQLPVFVATSFALTQDTAAEEGLSFPRAIEGSGKLNLSASVGHLAAVELLSQKLLDNVEPSNDVVLNGHILVSSLAPYGALYSYGSSSRLLQRAAAVYNRSLQLLNQFSSSETGLRWSRVPGSGWVDAYLNAYGLFIAQLSPNAEPVPTTLISQWKGALTSELIRRAEQARSVNSQFRDYDLLALARFSLGTSWNAASNNETIRNDLSSATLDANINSCSVWGKSLVALRYLREGSRIAFVADILATFTIRPQGRTAYIPATSGSATAADLGSNALGLFAFAKAGGDLGGLIEKLSNYIASQGESTSGRVPYYFSPSAFVYSAFGLSAYDASKGNDSPDIVVAVRSGKLLLLRATFTPKNLKGKTKTTLWDDLDQPPLPLRFVADGKGQVSIAAGLSFIPATLFLGSTYRGIYVEKTIQRKHPLTGLPFGPHLSSVSPGESVVVTIQVTIPDDSVGPIAILDPLPAGLEAFDPNLDLVVSDQGSNVMHYTGGKRSMLPYDSFWSYWGFTTRETRKDQVQFYSERLTAGTYTVQYDALAVTTGVFSVPSAKAFYQLQPEVLGLSPTFAFAVGVDERQVTLDKILNVLDGNSDIVLSSGGTLCVSELKAFGDTFVSANDLDDLSKSLSGQSSYISVGYDAISGETYTLVQFKLPDIKTALGLSAGFAGELPENISAVLSLPVKNFRQWNGTPRVSVHLLPKSWNERKATWGCQTKESKTCTSWNLDNSIAKRATATHVINNNLRSSLDFDVTADLSLEIKSAKRNVVSWLIKKTKPSTLGFMDIWSTKEIRPTLLLKKPC